AWGAVLGGDPLGCGASSPNSTSRRMASGRVGWSLCLVAQASTRSRSSDETLMLVRAPLVRPPPFVGAAISFLFFFHLHHLSTEQQCSIPRTEVGGNSCTAPGTKRTSAISSCLSVLGARGRWGPAADVSTAR